MWHFVPQDPNTDPYVIKIRICGPDLNRFSVSAPGSSLSLCREGPVIYPYFSHVSLCYLFSHCLCISVRTLEYSVSQNLGHEKSHPFIQFLQSSQFPLLASRHPSITEPSSHSVGIASIAAGLLQSATVLHPSAPAVIWVIFSKAARQAKKEEKSWGTYINVSYTPQQSKVVTCTNLPSCNLPMLVLVEMRLSPVPSSRCIIISNHYCDEKLMVICNF
jgi:hypothetical protein